MKTTCLSASKAALILSLASLTLPPVSDLQATDFTKVNIVNDRGASSGGLWIDYDNDGWLDLFVANRQNQNDYLYHNDGNGTFTQVTDSIVAIDGEISNATSCADYDNDGYADLIVTTPGDDLLYHNNGDGTFTRITDSIVATNGGNSSSTSWVDYDNDGYLDLYVSNNPGPKFLYRNNRDGTFIKVTNSITDTDPTAAAGNTWGDYDNDGDLDLFVCTPGDNNVLFRNDGGDFTKITTGILVNEGGLGFGCAWGDYDNDGWLDLFVCNGGSISAEQNFLYHNNGDGTFTKITTGDIVNEASHWSRCAWGDYDNDSFLDLFVTDRMDNNALYHNNGDSTFTKITSGDPVNDGGNSFGCAWGDYDNDGFLDLFVGNGLDTGDEANFLYRNNGNSNSWIKLRLVGTRSNRSGVGAKVKVNAVIGQSNRWLTRSIVAGEFNGNTSALVIGLGDATNVSTLRIEWPSGTVQELHNVAINQFLTVTESVYMALYVFGSSWADTQNTGIYWQEHWSNGPMWPEFLSTNFGFAYTPANNFAVGGSLTDVVLSQAASFNPPAHPELCLYHLWAGYTDIRRTPDNLGSDVVWNARIVSWVGNISNAIVQLYGKGARSIIVPNAFDRSREPWAVAQFGSNSTNQVLFRQRITEFNGALAQALQNIDHANPDLRLYTLNMQSKVNDFHENTASYGFTKTFPGAIDDPSLVDKSFTGPGQDYLYWDSQHPTSKAHKIIATWNLEAITNAVLERLAGSAAANAFSLRMSKLLIFRDYTLRCSV